MHPDWLQEPSWVDVVRTADRLTVKQAAAAMAKLAILFPPDWVSACTVRHGVAQLEITYAGRLVLLELGHAAAVVGVDDALTSRLRAVGEFLGAAAELRAALLLTRSRGALKREVRGTGTRLSEFVVRWTSGVEAVVEVKALNLAAEVREAERVVTMAYFEIMRLADTLRGVRGHIDWDDAILESPLGDLAVIAAVRHAMSAASLATAPDTAIPIAGIGVLHLTPDPSQTALALYGGGFSPSDATIFRRLRRRCNDALQQIATHPKLAGMIILDVEADGLARNGLGLLAAWVRSKPQLGAVLVFDRESNAGRSYGHVHLLAGARHEEVAPIESALETCSAGHVHNQPLCTPSVPCPAHFWLQRAL